jgi:integrase
VERTKYLAEHSRPIEEAPEAVPGQALVRRSPQEAGKARLAVAAELVAARQDEFASKNTRRAYEFELACFTSWCNRKGFGGLQDEPDTIAVYAQELADRGRDPADVPQRESAWARAPKPGPLLYSSIIRALGAICSSHTRRDMPSPWKRRAVVRAREGIARQLGVKPTKKKALTVDLMQLLVDQIPVDTFRGKRDRALILLGWHGARRRSEIVAARFEHFRRDVDPHGKPGVVWLIPVSKTDQGGAGFELPLVFAMDRRYCAIRALGEWTKAAGITSGPLFRKIDTMGRLCDDALTPEHVRVMVRSYAKAAGLEPDDFGGHSLRSGWITTAAKGKRSTHEIMRVSGHRDPKMVEEYIQDANVLEDAPGEGLI